MKGLIFFHFIICVVANLNVERDLSSCPLPQTMAWLKIQFVDDHENLQPIQPPSFWTNYTFWIPPVVSNIQFTSLDPNKTCVYPKPVSERVVYYNISKENVILFSVIWWGKPWTLFIGLS